MLLDYGRFYFFNNFVNALTSSLNYSLSVWCTCQIDTKIEPVYQVNLFSILMLKNFSRSRSACLHLLRTYKNESSQVSVFHSILQCYPVRYHRAFFLWFRQTYSLQPAFGDIFPHLQWLEFLPWWCKEY